MDAVALALFSAALFGAMTVALRPALARGDDPFVGALFTIVPALCVAGVFARVGVTGATFGFTGFAARCAATFSAAIAAALFCAVAGALPPARAASRVDPARALEG